MDKSTDQLPNHPQSRLGTAPDDGPLHQMAHTGSQPPQWPYQLRQLETIDLTQDASHPAKRQRTLLPYERYQHDNIVMNGPSQLIRQNQHLWHAVLQERDARRHLEYQIEQVRNDLKLSQANNQRLGEQLNVLQSEKVQQQAESLTLKNEVERLRGISTLAQKAKLTVIKNVVVSNANIEAAIDSREAEMRVGLSNLACSPELIQARAIQMLNYSNATSFLISRLVVGAMLQHQDFLSEEENEEMEPIFNNAEPNLEVADIIGEKLPFMMEGPERHQSLAEELKEATESASALHDREV